MLQSSSRYHSHLGVGAPVDHRPHRGAHSLGDLLVEVDVGKEALVVVTVDLLDITVSRTHSISTSPMRKQAQQSQFEKYSWG
jgi:hypothetical protein